ncbi:MAG: hypothetical protein WD894_12895 [Pirellulales bacterium]
MPELEYFVVAEAHAVDRTSNSISIYNVLNELKYDRFPVDIPRLVFVSCWISSPEEVSQRLNSQIAYRIDLPDLPTTPFRMNFTSEAEFQNLIAEFFGLRVNAPTTFKIELLFNNEHKAYHTIKVMESVSVAP